MQKLCLYAPNSMGGEFLSLFLVFCPEVFGRGGKDKDGFKTEHHRDSGYSLCADYDTNSLRRTNFKDLKFQTGNIKSRRLKPGSRIDELNGGKVCVSDRKSKTVTSYFILKSKEDNATYNSLEAARS